MDNQCKLHFDWMIKRRQYQFLRCQQIGMYNRIPLSRAPLTHGIQLVALAPWTPNFSDSSLAAAHITEPMTHMCWSEQISPLVHSSQATWQPFNLSHCIEMHKTHLLGHVVRRISHILILTPHNLPLTVNKQWPPMRESRMSRRTRFNTYEKTESDTRHIFSVQMQFKGRYNRFIELYFAFLLYW